MVSNAPDVYVQNSETAMSSSKEVIMESVEISEQGGIWRHAEEEEKKSGRRRKRRKGSESKSEGKIKQGYIERKGTVLEFSGLLPSFVRRCGRFEPIQIGSPFSWQLVVHEIKIFIGSGQIVRKNNVW